jgi:hypothetical protein
LKEPGRARVALKYLMGRVVMARAKIWPITKVWSLIIIFQRSFVFNKFYFD